MYVLYRDSTTVSAFMKLKGLVLLAFAVSLLELLVLTLDIHIYDLLQQQNVHTAISRLNLSIVEQSLNKTIT